jgi:hypothetical protein
MSKIYVASSWRNLYYPEVVKRLREAGHEVYDFRNPPQGGHGFRWTDVDPHCAEWTFGQYAEGMEHPAARKQFANDVEALEWADTCVLVLPCGRSAHTEAGWCKGRGMRTFVYIPKMEEPELMYKLFDGVVGTLDDLIPIL